MTTFKLLYLLFVLKRWEKRLKFSCCFALLLASIFTTSFVLNMFFCEQVLFSFTSFLSIFLKVILFLCHCLKLLSILLFCSLSPSPLSLFDVILYNLSLSNHHLFLCLWVKSVSFSRHLFLSLVSASISKYQLISPAFASILSICVYL